MSLRIDVISIGTLARNRLWKESQSLRTPHATTSLIRAGNELILVDPGLPGRILAARLTERTGLHPDQITAVFLTNFLPWTFGGLDIFTKAKRFVSESEQQTARSSLESLIEQAPNDDLDRATFQANLQLLKLFRPAPDTLARGVDLFPLPGYTAGTCGLLVAMPTATALLTGAAVATQDHFLAGQVLPESADLKTGQESMAEVYEIADWIVPGHDNLFVNPRNAGL